MYVCHGEEAEKEGWKIAQRLVMASQMSNVWQEPTTNIINKTCKPVKTNIDKIKNWDVGQEPIKHQPEVTKIPRENPEKIKIIGL